MAEQVKARRGREGSRWINERPPSEEVAKWWVEVVAPTLHEGMDADRYLPGLTLIQNKETVKNEIVGYNDQGHPQVAEVNYVVFTPYPKVDTRIQYFWDLMELHDDWLGVIEPVGGDRGLPPGIRIVKTGQVRDGREVQFVSATMQVRVFRRETVKLVQHNDRGVATFTRTGELVFDSPPATKLLNMSGRWGPDPQAIMKAETGAVGRALGMAGMLVVPGAGVATAEDINEHLNSPELPAEAPSAQAAAPAPEMTEDELREKATELSTKLSSEFPDQWKDFCEWAKSRGVGKIADLVNPNLRAFVKQLERKIAEAEAAAVEAPEG